MGKKIILPLFFLIIVIIVGGLWEYTKITQKKQIVNEIKKDWENKIGQEESEYLREISKRTTYKIRKIKKEENVVFAEVEIIGIDLGAVLDEIGLNNLPQSQNKDDIEKFLMNLLKDTDVIETTADIVIEMNGDDARIIYSEEFVDAMSGKVYSYALRVIEKLMKDIEE